VNCCPECELTAEVERVGRSPLLARGGIGIYRGLFDRPTLAQLRIEATTRPRRVDVVAPGLDAEPVRGGTPARQMIGVDGGLCQSAIFGSPDLAAFVAGEVDAPAVPCGKQASYTIYAGPDAYLDIHRDVTGCDVALITCLHDSDAQARGGAIDFWPEDLATPLVELRARPDRRRARFSLEPGDSLLIHGGVLPHRIPPADADRLRIVSLMCFGIRC